MFGIAADGTGGQQLAQIIGLQTRKQRQQLETPEVSPSDTRPQLEPVRVVLCFPHAPLPFKLPASQLVFFIHHYQNPITGGEVEHNGTGKQLIMEASRVLRRFSRGFFHIVCGGVAPGTLCGLFVQIKKARFTIRTGVLCAKLAIRHLLISILASRGLR